MINDLKYGIVKRINVSDEMIVFRKRIGNILIHFSIIEYFITV